MKREKTLTKKEKKALKGPRPEQHDHDHQHIHCVACGRHLDPSEFRSAAATWLTCKHGSRFASCADCANKGRQLLEAHDRSGRPVEAASAWH